MEGKIIKSIVRKIPMRIAYNFRAVPGSCFSRALIEVRRLA